MKASDFCLYDGGAYIISSMATSLNQDDYLKTALRLPRPLHAKIQGSAMLSGRSMNAEIIALVELGFGTPHADTQLDAQVETLKASLAQQRRVIETQTKLITAAATFFKFSSVALEQSADPLVKNVREALSEMANQINSGSATDLPQSLTDFAKAAITVLESLSLNEGETPADTSKKAGD